RRHCGGPGNRRKGLPEWPLRRDNSWPATSLRAGHLGGAACHNGSPPKRASTALRRPRGADPSSAPPRPPPQTPEPPPPPGNESAAGVENGLRCTLTRTQHSDAQGRHPPRFRGDLQQGPPGPWPRRLGKPATSSPDRNGIDPI